MTVISRNFSLTEDDQYTLDHPIVGYHNLADTANTTSTSEDPDYPLVNVANPATNLKWRAESDTGLSDVYIEVVLDGTEEVDYLAIAGHNLWTAGVTISVEGAPDEDSNAEPDWDTVSPLVDETLLANDRPLLLRFTRAALFGVRLRIQYPASLIAEPELAVLYVGKLLTLQRKIYVGHAPITLSRSSTVSNGRSESGQFLGRIVTGESNYTSVALKNLTPDWVRDYLDPFFEDAVENPFFFAWRPASYPNEVGYGYLTGDPQPINDQPNGMMTAEFSMGGIVT